jgi:hypothetical protein
MLSPIFESLLDPKLSHARYERYDGINEVLIISTEEHEVRVTNEYIRLDSVEYNMNLVNPFNGIPIHRETIAFIDYKMFLLGSGDNVFGVTKDDVNALLTYFRSLG